MIFLKTLEFLGKYPRKSPFSVKFYAGNFNGNVFAPLSLVLISRCQKPE